MAVGEYKEIKVYLKVTNESRWVWDNRKRSGKNSHSLSVRAMKKLPSMKDRKWNDYYFPIVVKVPMFFTSDEVEVKLPPIHEGQLIIQALEEGAGA